MEILTEVLISFLRSAKAFSNFLMKALNLLRSYRKFRVNNKHSKAIY